MCTHLRNQQLDQFYRFSLTEHLPAMTMTLDQHQPSIGSTHRVRCVTNIYRQTARKNSIKSDIQLLSDLNMPPPK